MATFVPVATQKLGPKTCVDPDPDTDPTHELFAPCPQDAPHHGPTKKKVQVKKIAPITLTLAPERLRYIFLFGESRFQSIHLQHDFCNMRLTLAASGFWSNYHDRQCALTCFFGPYAQVRLPLSQWTVVFTSNDGVHKLRYQIHTITRISTFTTPLTVRSSQR